MDYAAYYVWGPESQKMKTSEEDGEKKILEKFSKVIISQGKSNVRLIVDTSEQLAVTWLHHKLPAEI